MSKLGDSLVLLYDSMPRPLKMFNVVMWIYLGIRFLIKDVAWIMDKLL